MGEVPFTRVLLAGLVTDEALRTRIFRRIKDEWVLTRDMLSTITGTRGLLGDSPALADSIQHRFAYLDPLNNLQVELLRRYRGGSDDERIQHAIHITINGIAAGLRNSG